MNSNQLEQDARRLFDRGELVAAADMYRAASKASRGRHASRLLSKAYDIDWVLETRAEKASA